MGHKTSMEDLKKRESFKRLITLSLAAVCLLAECLIFTYFWRFHFFKGIVNDLEFDRRWHILQVAIYGVLLFFFSNTYGGLDIGYLKNMEIIFSQVFATLAVNVIMYGEISLMSNRLADVRYILEMTVFQILAVILWANTVTRVYRSYFPPRRLLLIHGDRPVQDLRSKLESRKDKYEVTKCEHVRIGLEHLKRDILAGYAEGLYNAVVLCDLSIQERKELLKFCYANGIRIYIMPKIADVILIGAEEMHLFDTPILLTREYCLTMEQRFFKRLIDIVCACLLLIIASPFMLLTAAAVRLYDGGPVLYKQTRCTLGGREFSIMKFRSMGTDAERDGVARLAQKDDDRITPIGRFIRRVRIDELPQLFNIIKGDMSFIGPRPERPEIMAQYVEIMPEFQYRLKVKAGLAGYAQVYGKYNTTPYDKLKLDLTYIENYSLWLDIKLMLLTLKILFWSDSTEGVESAQVTAFKEEYDRERHYREREGQEMEAAEAEDGAGGQ